MCFHGCECVQAKKTVGMVGVAVRERGGGEGLYRIHSR